MKLPTFLLYTTLGAGIWNIVLATIGYYLSSVPGMENEEVMMQTVTKYSKEIGYGIIIVVVLVIAILVYKGLKKPKDINETA